MEKRLNLDHLTQAMDKKGLNQATLARELSVSRESVSKWLNNKAFPRPDKLLYLSKLVGLGYADLVIRDDPNAPVVAFRNMRGTKTKDHHIEHAQTMGRMLQHLVPYLPFDVLSMPPVLREPRLDYEYLRQVVTKIRQEIVVEPTGTIDFHHLIRFFSKLHAVLIPVLWGDGKQQKNATHIYLPDSQTTWVYLNLDVFVHDFKFWMAHELGHCLAPLLRDDTSEDFADAFAGSLLFPHELASDAYSALSQVKNDKTRLEMITLLANNHLISPYTVYKQTNYYARENGLALLQLEPQIHKWNTNFNKNCLSVSHTLFNGAIPPEPVYYKETISQIFETPFFDVLSKYLREQHKGPGFVQTVMDIPLLDARSLHDVLT
jgi:transcriptional regulator with XRE-family HTH domain